MRYRVLGKTGIEVSTHCLGTMMFGAVGNPDHQDGARVIRAALDAGVNFVDTADMYSAGESEEIVGKALKGVRDDVVLATKVHFPLGEGRNRSGNSRRWILRAVEDSLRRLDTDWIDLYQVHRPDHTTDIEETLSVLTDLVRAGRIRAFGCSTFPAEDLVEAHHVAERRGLMRLRTEQPPYSILARGVERAVLPTAQRLGMGVLTWSPLASGFLSGAYREGRPVDLTTGRPRHTPHRFDPALPGNAAKYAAVERLVALAGDMGRTLPELAVAFPLVHPAVTSVIIGPRTMDQLTALLKGADLVLDDGVLDRIDEIVAPGTDLYRADGVWQPRSLNEPALRRRPAGERAAAD
ncbi:aldo/keto reductase [Streptomyces heilongjiangensis]|uniref:Aldo/keto reductase n=1 Tax=Streptomyces heilongjiangensis TaxID=945052 RepID=A0ABW1AZM8_9ACTN|nr:aldo/keto reductase [Streptomyces heilongjiangensis]MDC2951513.1 aldo/keto reductase [Streptomyces heilongjiangensis]